MKMKNNENTVPHCSECEFLKMYDFMTNVKNTCDFSHERFKYKNYYCDHEDRSDDMGKLGVDYPPKTSPEWCPKRKKE